MSSTWIRFEYGIKHDMYFYPTIHTVSDFSYTLTDTTCGPELLTL